MRKQLVVPTCIVKLKQYVEWTVRCNQIELPGSREMLGRRWKVAIGPDRAEPCVHARQGVEQAREILRIAARHDIEILRRDRRPMNDSRGAADDNEVDASCR